MIAKIISHPTRDCWLAAEAATSELGLPTAVGHRAAQLAWRHYGHYRPPAELWVKLMRAEVSAASAEHSSGEML